MKSYKNITIYTFKNIQNPDSASKVIMQTVLQLSNNFRVNLVDANHSYRSFLKLESKTNVYPYPVNRILKGLTIFFDNIGKVFFKSIPKNEIGYITLIPNFLSFLKLLYVLKKTKSDAVYAFFPHTIPTAYLSTKITDTRLVFGSHNVEYSRISREYGSSNATRLIKVLEKYALTNSDITTVVSRSDKKLFSELTIRKNKIIVIPNSLPKNTKKKIDLKEVQFLKEKYGLLGSQIIVMHSDWTFKPNEQSLSAFFSRVYRQVLAEVPEVYFLIIGRTNKKINLPNVIQLGWVDNLYVHLMMADVGVIPQIVGGGGSRNKLVDYLCMGIPTVSTELGSEGIDIMDRKHAFICPKVDQDFVFKIIELLSNKDLKEKFSRNSEAFFQKNLTTEKGVSNLSEVITL
tara:strand:+ start:83 stop:1288 length:1206 start_codon:yes stop_codon:yes gene_type:complete